MTALDFAPVDPEFVALRFAKRSGYRLVSYGEVALPVYRLGVRSLVVLESKLSTTEIFVLRCISKGLKTVEDVAGVLGLDKRFVISVLAELLRANQVVLAAYGSGKSQGLVLTSKGLRTLETEAAEHPEERSIQLYWDGLTRRVVALSDRGLITVYDAKKQGLRRMPAIAGRPPTADDLDRLDVERMLDEVSGRRKRMVSILSFIEIESRYVVYQPAVALVYRGRTPSDLLVSFCIDGKLSQDHETAFAKADGVKRLKIADELTQNQEDVQLPEPLTEPGGGPSKIDTDTDSDVADALLARAERESAEEAVKESVEDSEREIALSRAKAASERLEQAEEAMTRPTVRHLTMPEHGPLLHNALSDSRQRLLIISPWIRAGVVNYKFIGKLRDLLRAGVDVYIGWGIGDEKEKGTRDRDASAIDDLERLANQFDNMRFRYIGNTHAKILIQDRKLAIYTSFNWLSFKGDPNRPFRDENGLLVTVPEKVDQLFETQAVLFERKA